MFVFETYRAVFECITVNFKTMTEKQSRFMFYFLFTNMWKEDRFYEKYIFPIFLCDVLIQAYINGNVTFIFQTITNNLMFVVKEKIFSIYLIGT